MSRSIRPLAAVLSLCLLAASAVPALAAAPGNDDIGGPIVITDLPYSNNQDTTEATTGATDPDCDGTGPTVWYEHTPAEDGRLEANTFGSDYDTTLVVGTSDGSGGVDIIACNDDVGGVQSRVRFDAEAGVAYLFMVGAYAGGPGGDLVFNLLPAPAAADVQLSITVDGTAQFGRDGTATISGTATCTGADEVEVYAVLSQQVGRFRVVGDGGTVIECAPEGVPWEVQVRGITGKFGGGRATAYVDAYTCGEDECDFDFVETSVRLRR